MYSHSGIRNIVFLHFTIVNGELETSLIPNKRIVLLDVMRAWAVLMMIQGHSIDALLSDSYYNSDSLLFNIWLFNRGLTAPIFLFGSGFAYVIATFRKMSAGDSLPKSVIFKRLRWIGVLFLIGSLMHLPAGTIGDMFTLTPETWQRFFNVDVLRLMSVTLLGGVGGDAGEKLPQPLKRVGLQKSEQWIHGQRLSRLSGGPGCSSTDRRAKAAYFLVFLRAGADLAADLAAGLTACLATGLPADALGTSPIRDLTGQILKTGHFLQPTAMAMGQMVIIFLCGCWC